MKFSDFVQTNAICAKVESTEKEAVIRELVGCLVSSGQLKDSEQENIVQAVLKREELGSTGIGRGVAVPHTKHPGVSKLVGTVGVEHGCVRPVDAGGKGRDESAVGISHCGDVDGEIGRASCRERV